MPLSRDGAIGGGSSLTLIEPPTRGAARRRPSDSSPPGNDGMPPRTFCHRSLSGRHGLQEPAAAVLRPDPGCFAARRGARFKLADPGSHPAWSRAPRGSDRQTAPAPRSGRHWSGNRASMQLNSSAAGRLVALWFRIARARTFRLLPTCPAASPGCARTAALEDIELHERGSGVPTRPRASARSHAVQVNPERSPVPRGSQRRPDVPAARVTPDDRLAEVCAQGVAECVHLAVGRGLEPARGVGHVDQVEPDGGVADQRPERPGVVLRGRRETPGRRSAVPP